MRIMRLMGMALAFAPVTVLAQAKPAEGKAMAAPAMKHDMSKMGADTGMKHDMAAMMGVKTGWTEFDALHTLVMSVWMAADKGDLKPGREKSAEISKAADAWLASKGPASCDNAAARKAMPAAVAGLKTIEALAKRKGGDAELKAAITKAHDSFRPVAQPCVMAAMGKTPTARKPMGGMDQKKPMDGMDHSKMDHSKMDQSAAPKKP